MNDKHYVMSSRVRLARNYDDLPFDTAGNEELADACVDRTAGALARSGDDAGFELIRLRDLNDIERRTLAESHLISKDLLRDPATAAALINADEQLTVMINEDDHLRIQAICAGADILSAAQKVFRIDDALSRQVRFAFDEQLGYLTSYPTNTGTGMRASLLMHLPMLTMRKQMGNVGQITAKVGLTIRGVYGEGSEALGNIYQVGNQVTLGRTEQEIISALDAVGRQLIQMEHAAREAAMANNRIVMEDAIYRAWGTLRHARLIQPDEFYRLWSQVRLGSSLGLLPVTPEAMDVLLDQVQDAHLSAWAEKALTGPALDEARAARIRELLRGNGPL